MAWYLRGSGHAPSTVEERGAGVPRPDDVGGAVALQAREEPNDPMDIKVLGPGCKNCVTPEARTREALDGLGKDATIEKVTDTAPIMGYGVMSTPGLVIDGEVVVSGRVPSVKQLARLMRA